MFKYFMIERIAILFSCLVHLILLISISLTFSFIHVNANPGFVFLGPILSKEDLTVHLPSFAHSFVPTGLQAIEFSNWENPYSDWVTIKKEQNKINYGSQIRTPGKRILKSSFLNNEEDLWQKEKLLEELGIETPFPLRGPLTIGR
jgi:hypothetical protein